MKYANRTYRVKVDPNMVEYTKTVHEEDWTSSWGGNEMYHEGGSHKETFSKREGTSISFYPISRYKKTNCVGYWCNDLAEIQSDYKAMLRLSELYGFDIPHNIFCEVDFSSTAEKSFIIEDELSNDEFTLQIQYGMSGERYYFSDANIFELIPHNRFEKYQFDKLVLTNLSDDDFSEIETIIRAKITN